MVRAAAKHGIFRRPKLLSDTKIRAAKARAKPYKISDGQQLYLYVTTAGGKLWRMNYQYNQRQRTMSFGSYPMVGLTEARQLRDKAKRELFEGNDPGIVKKVEIAERRKKNQLTFEVLARAWHETNKSRWAEVHTYDVIHSLERDVFPAIGKLPIDCIDAPTVLKVLRKVEARGSIETAKRLRQRISAAFVYGIAEGLIRARELAHVDAGIAADWRSTILPSVNAFMVSDAFRGSHITTGTVLQTAPRSFWLCVSPSCDLEPRGEGPVILQLIKLTKTTTLPARFSTGEYVAITGKDGPIILQALKTDSRQPSLRVVFLPAGTRVSRDLGDATAAPTISGWFATGASPDWLPVPINDVPLAAEDSDTIESNAEADDDVAPHQEAILTSQAMTFTVVSQLRNAFATRFLMSAGQHLSRIGVDFIDS